MLQKFFSMTIWVGIALLVLLWLPILGIFRLFDWDSTRYRTGKTFRKLGYFISRINPNWYIEIEGAENIDDRTPYVMVSNHLSNADIPLISNLPWEMKWVAKKELFKVPFLGWMMSMSGDISVDRASNTKRAGIFTRSSFYLKRKCSVMFFPEGTRSRTGLLNTFSTGAFDLAIQEKVPILPIVIDGTQDCLPKKTWVFKRAVQIKLKVLSPIDTSNLKESDTLLLMNRVRSSIANQLSEWRELPLTEVDATVKSAAS